MVIAKVLLVMTVLLICGCAGTEPTATLAGTSLTARLPIANLSQTTVASQNIAPALVKGVYTHCAVWGDSLTLGNQDGSGITVTTALKALGHCAQVHNEGMDGSTSTQIAVRSGAVASTATIVGGMIPASGDVLLTFKAGYEPVSYQPVYISIAGVSGVVNYSNSIFTFTRSTAGVAVYSPPNSPFSVEIGDINNGLVVIWIGTNNVTAPDQVKSDIAAMVRSLPRPKHYLVMGVLNSDDPWYWSTNGQAIYTTMSTLNSDLAAIYEDHFIDIRKLLIGAYDPHNAQDLIDVSHDVVPSSLRAQNFGGTLVGTILDPNSCSFTLGPGLARHDTTITLEAEKIYLSATDGTNVTACIRGYANTVASAHVAGAPFTGIDTLHLSGSPGDTFVAGRINNWMLHPD